MLGCIIGITVVFASDTADTYSIAVCGLSWPDRRNQETDVLQIVGYLAAGLVFTTSAVNSLVYSPEGAKEAAAAGFILLSMVAVSGFFTHPWLNVADFHRSSGCSILGPLHPLLHAVTSTPLLCTKTNESHIETADRCRMRSVVLDQKQQSPTIVLHRRCTLRPSWMDSRPRLLSQDILEVALVRHAILLHREPLLAMGRQQQTRRTTKSANRPSTHIEPKLYTRTRPTQTMQMKSAFRNMRSLKSQTSVVDGGKRRKRLARLVLHHQTISFCYSDWIAIWCFWSWEFFYGCDMPTYPGGGFLQISWKD